MLHCRIHSVPENFSGERWCGSWLGCVPFLNQMKQCTSYNVVAFIRGRDKCSSREVTGLTANTGHVVGCRHSSFLTFAFPFLSQPKKNKYACFFSFIIHWINKHLLVSHSVGHLHELIRPCILGTVFIVDEIMTFWVRQTNKIPSVLEELCRVHRLLLMAQR